MLRLPRTTLMLVALVAVLPVLAGCSNFDPSNLDFFGLGDKKPLPGKRELLFPNGVPGVSQGIPPQYREGYHAPAIGDLPPGDTDATTPAGASQTAKAVPTRPVQESNFGRPMEVHKRVRKTTIKHEARPKHRRVVKHKVKKKTTATAAKPAIKTKTEAKGVNAPWPSTPQQAKGAQAPWPSTQPKGAQAPWPSTSTASSEKSQSTQAGWPSGGDSQKAKQKLAPWPSAPPSGSFSKQ
jgi:hypothetical protein